MREIHSYRGIYPSLHPPSRSRKSNCTNSHLLRILEAILNANTINGSRSLSRQRRAISGKDLATVMMWTDPRLGFYALVNEGNEEAMKKMQDQITNLMRQQVDINKIMTNMSEINADEHQLTRQMIREGLCGVEISLQEGFSQLSLRLSLNNYLQNIQAIINAVLDGRIGPLVISWNLAENITKEVRTNAKRPGLLPSSQIPPAIPAAEQDVLHDPGHPSTGSRTEASIHPRLSSKKSGEEDIQGNVSERRPSRRNTRAVDKDT